MLKHHASANPQAKSVLTIAGSDSGGGAGIQADLKTISAHGCYGTSVITAITAQNTLGVQGVHSVPPSFVTQQIRSVLDDIELHAIKTGMLFDANTILTISSALKSNDFVTQSLLPPLVCDPVCVSTSGHELLDPNAIQVLVDELFPVAKLITPNKAEAQMLLNLRNLPATIDSLDDMLIAARNLLQLGSAAALLKGGHLITSHMDVHRIHATHPDIDIIYQELLMENMEILKQYQPTFHTTAKLVADVLCEESGKVTLFVRPHIDSKSTHGTGCTLSAAIACNLANGLPLKEAVKCATHYTHLGIQTAHQIGHGHGPLNHFHAVAPRIIPPPTKLDPHPLTRMLIEGSAATWKAYVEHDFVKLLGRGTLPKKAFIYFIVQDYHYLKYYARAYALLGAKSITFESIQMSIRNVMGVVAEVESSHKIFCLAFGIDRDTLENTPEALETTAYGAFLMDIGLQGDGTKLLMALLACLLGYGEVGLWLKRQALLPDSWVKWENNPFKPWMDEYSGEDYQSAVQTGLELIESRAVADLPSRATFEEWREIWERCTRFEKAFWDVALAAVGE